MAVTFPTDADDDDPGGIPLAPRARPPGPGGPPPRATADSDGDDPDDGSVDQGDAVGPVHRRVDASNATPVPDGEGILLGRAAAEEEGRYAALLATLGPDLPVWARWAGSAGLAWGVALAGVVLTLFVLAQAALLAAQVGTLVPALRYPGYAAAGVLVAAFTAAAGRLGMVFARFRRSPALRADALFELAARQRVRADYTRRVFDHVFHALHPLLAAYPLDDRAAARLRGWGAEDAQVARLRAARDHLLPARAAKGAWVEEFRDRFLAVLDEVAAARIRRAAWTAGKLTAVSPRGAIDALVVSAVALDLVRDVCAIYHLRANRVDTVRVLAAVVLSAGVAGQADDWARAAGDGVADGLPTDWLPGVAGAAAKGVLGPLAGAVTDGAVNAGLVWRIGRQTRRAVRPLG